MAAVAEFTVDHQAWFWLWLPLDKTVPTDDTYRLWVRRLEPETAMKAALLLVRAAFEDAEWDTFTPTVQDHCETREWRTCTVPASASRWQIPTRGLACAV